MSEFGIASPVLAEEELMSAGTSKGTPNRRVLVVGASRGLGEAIVESYVARGARVVGTVRGSGPSPLHEYARSAGAALEIEQVDVTIPEQLASFRKRLEGRCFDLLFVVAGISLAAQDAIGAEIATRDFEMMMDTNVLGVMRAVEVLQDLVEPGGTIAAMSSGQGSVAGNTSGGFEVYRATKAALNQMFRSYAARHAHSDRALLLMAPGWVKTSLGGPGALLDIAESVPPLVDTVDAQHGASGLHYLDRHGAKVAW